jgi:Ca2+-binding RTX toxin-like protein
MNPNAPHIRLAIAGALALAVALPATAGAATISSEGGALVYRGAPGEKNITGPSEGIVDAAKLRFSDSVPIAIATSACTAQYDWVECDVPAKVVMDLGDGDDRVTFGGAFDIAYEVYGGDGNDELLGYTTGSADLRQTLDGGAGNDKLDGDRGADVVRGGAGNDDVDGGLGGDVVQGGDGDDTLYGEQYDFQGTDTIDGGAGFDRMDADYVIPGEDVNPAVAISFDGAANDGRPGENDNIVGVEKLDSSVPGTFTGSAGADDFFVKADFGVDAVSAVRGLGGNDHLVGHDHVETIDGGPGDDVIEGGLNNDTLTGGPGKDTIYGDSTKDTCNFLSCRIAFGNDVIDARDGEQDTIDCGVGEDRATVDAIDVVANCEQVDKSGKGANPPQGGGRLDGPKRYSRKALRKGLALRVDCAAACTVKFTLTADRRTARKLGTKVIASGKRSRATAGTVKLRAKLTKPARKRLGRLRKGHGTLAAVVTENGASQRYTRKVTLIR